MVPSEGSSLRWGVEGGRPFGCLDSITYLGMGLKVSYWVKVDRTQSNSSCCCIPTDDMRSTLIYLPCGGQIPMRQSSRRQDERRRLGWC